MRYPGTACWSGERAKWKWKKTGIGRHSPRAVPHEKRRLCIRFAVPMMHPWILGRFGFSLLILLLTFDCIIECNSNTQDVVCSDFSIL
jgi:hypothetical protein